MYVTARDLWLSCSYREPVYEHAPDVATYSTERQLFVPKETGIELDERGYVDCIDMDISFGVSLYPGELTIHDKLLPLVGEALKEISPQEYAYLREQREAQERRLADIVHAGYGLDFLREEWQMLEEEINALSVSVLTQEKYLELSKELWENVLSQVKLRAEIAALSVW